MTRYRIAPDELADPRLEADVIHSPTDGFLFQMQASIDGDGFWYEGAWGYHFYALDALAYLAEMARHAGVDLYAEPDGKALQLHLTGFMWNGQPFLSKDVVLVQQ